MNMSEMVQHVQNELEKAIGDKDKVTLTDNFIYQRVFGNSEQIRQFMGGDLGYVPSQIREHLLSVACMRSELRLVLVEIFGEPYRVLCKIDALIDRENAYQGEIQE